MRIAYQQIAVFVDAQSTRPAVAIIGGRPAMIEEIAVAIKNLNARGPINEIEAVLGIDGGSARFDQLASLDAALAPDALGLISAFSTATHGKQATEQRQHQAQARNCFSRARASGTQWNFANAQAHFPSSARWFE